MANVKSNSLQSSGVLNVQNKPLISEEWHGAIQSYFYNISLTTFYSARDVLKILM